MIRIYKPDKVPAKLEDEGIMLTIANCADYEANPNAYINDEEEFVISSAIYNHSTVKKSLKRAQFNKCCFCEKEQNDEYGAVEHYRPKMGYKSQKKDRLKKPGYYWLGYEWSNLYFVCSPCNTKKANFFPLHNEDKRATWHKMDISDERPFLLDPAGEEDPRKHIVFDNEFPRGITEIGKKTIEICSLDRDGLNGKRKKILNQIDDNILILMTKEENSVEVVERAKQFILKCKEKESEFSAAASDYLKKFNIELA
jgi:hypothetical protein